MLQAARLPNIEVLRLSPKSVDNAVLMLTAKAAVSQNDKLEVEHAIQDSIQAHRFGSPQAGVPSQTADIGGALLSMVKLQKQLGEDGSRPTSETHFGVRVPDYRTQRDYPFLLHIHVKELEVCDVEEVARAWRAEAMARIEATGSELLKIRRERIMELYHLFLTSEASLISRGLPTTYERARVGYGLLEELGVLACLAAGNSAAISKFYNLVEIGWSKRKADIPMALATALGKSISEKEEAEAQPPKKVQRTEVPVTTTLVVPSGPLPGTQPQHQQQFFRSGSAPFRGRGRGRGRGWRGF